MVRDRLEFHAQRASPPPNKCRRRPVTLYDCVAGRANSNGFMPEHAAVSSGRRTPFSSRVPAPPDEYLFRQKHAPLRYEEDDIYFADRHLAPHQRLPDSDLLKALHAHSSEAYNQAYGRQAGKLYRSLDETALLTLGILMEEAAADLFDSNGKLNLVGLEKKPGYDTYGVDSGDERLRPGSKGKRKRNPSPDKEDENSEDGAYHDVKRHWIQDGQ